MIRTDIEDAQKDLIGILFQTDTGTPKINSSHQLEEDLITRKCLWADKHALEDSK